jgi:hypothetical protein
VSAEADSGEARAPATGDEPIPTAPTTNPGPILLWHPICMGLSPVGGCCGCAGAGGSASPAPHVQGIEMSATLHADDSCCSDSEPSAVSDPARPGPGQAVVPMSHLLEAHRRGSTPPFHQPEGQALKAKDDRTEHKDAPYRQPIPALSGWASFVGGLRSPCSRRRGGRPPSWGLASGEVEACRRERWDAKPVPRLAGSDQRIPRRRSTVYGGRWDVRGNI